MTERDIIHVNRRPAMFIIEQVAKRWDLSAEDLLGPSRLKRIAHPRQQAMYEIRETLGYSLPRIGRIFGNRDHTTVLHSVRAHAARISVEMAA